MDNAEKLHRKRTILKGQPAVVNRLSILLKLQSIPDWRIRGNWQIINRPIERIIADGSDIIMVPRSVNMQCISPLTFILAIREYDETTHYQISIKLWEK